MIATMNANGQITIPADVREMLGLRPGQEVEFEVRQPKANGVSAAKSGNPFARAIGSRKAEFEETFGNITTREYLDLCRGPVDLPSGAGAQK